MKPHLEMSSDSCYICYRNVALYGYGWKRVCYPKDERPGLITTNKTEVYYFIHTSKGLSDTVLICLSPSPAGGRDEQEGQAAVGRICEEYGEAKGNFAEHVWEHMHSYTQVFKGLCLCALVLVYQYLKIKGRAAAVWFPQACFYCLNQTHTRHTCRECSSSTMSKRRIQGYKTAMRWVN